MIYDCIIIGGGASGLFCAAVFSEKVNGLILEGTTRAGTKLLMSGSGQCNITHGGSIKDFVPKYGKNGGKIRSCLYQHSNRSLEAFLNQNGVPTMTRDDGKVFPSSLNAGDILRMLCRRSEENGFHLSTNSRVTAINRITSEPSAAADAEGHERADAGSHAKANPGRQTTADVEDPAKANPNSGNNTSPLWQVSVSSENRPVNYLCRSLVIAAGGFTYPSTGSDGSIFRILKRDLDLDIIPLRPALTPVYVTDYPYSGQSGISFENAGLEIWRSADSEQDAVRQQDATQRQAMTQQQEAVRQQETPKQKKTPPVKDFKKLLQASGPILLTHENFSGPLILNYSRYIKASDRMVINYLYPLTAAEAAAQIQRAAAKHKMSMANLLAKKYGLPRSFLSAVLAETGEKPKAIAKRLTEDTFTVEALAGRKKAMVTAGGVALSEMNCKTMECKNLKNLYIIGETLDIDGETGGYNLQFAYSSACAAAAAITSQRQP